MYLRIINISNKTMLENKKKESLIKYKIKIINIRFICFDIVYQYMEKNQ